MKKHLLKTLLLSLLMLTNIPLPLASFSQNSNQEQNPVSKTYSMEQVIQLVKEIEEDASSSIAEAYEEGYKAALLEVKPEAIATSALNEQLQKDVEQLKKDKSKAGWTGALIGGAAGVIVTSVVFICVGIARP